MQKVAEFILQAGLLPAVVAGFVSVGWGYYAQRILARRWPRELAMHQLLVVEFRDLSKLYGSLFAAMERATRRLQASSATDLGCSWEEERQEIQGLRNEASGRFSTLGGQKERVKELLALDFEYFDVLLDQLNAINLRLDDEVSDVTLELKEPETEVTAAIRSDVRELSEKVRAALLGAQFDALSASGKPHQSSPPSLRRLVNRVRKL